MFVKLFKSQSSMLYASGFSCDNGVVLEIDGGGYFVTDSRYTLEAKEFLKKRFEVIQSNDLIFSIRKLLRQHKVKKVLFDPLEWNQYYYNKLTSSIFTSFFPVRQLSQKSRIIKSDLEIGYIKKAVKEGEDIFNLFSKWLGECGYNLSEKELFFNAKSFLEKKGELELSFSPIVAINENTAKPHALPTSKILNDKDLILFDAGIKYKNYCSDRTRTMLFDKDIQASKEQSFSNNFIQKIYDITLKAQEEAIKCIKPGISASYVDYVARRVITDAGYGEYFTHSTGHGVGLDIHELPVISKKSQTILEPNMVFTVEPGIYLPNQFGVRIEDMVVVTENGVEVL